MPAATEYPDMVYEICFFHWKTAKISFMGQAFALLLYFVVSLTCTVSSLFGFSLHYEAAIDINIRHFPVAIM
jgi:hypothetical protein